MHDYKGLLWSLRQASKNYYYLLWLIYSGNYYVPLDEEMPKHRIELILQSLEPKAVICDETSKALLEEFSFQGKVYVYDEIVGTKIKDEVLIHIRNQQIDTDPIYIVFTSGSTGIPRELWPSSLCRDYIKANVVLRLMRIQYLKSDPFMWMPA